jgi:cyanophycin synthetase
MEVSRIRALRGPNLWCRHTAIEAIVACQDATNMLSALPGFEDRLRARFPEIGPLRPDEESGELSLANLLVVTALRLKAAAGCAVTFCRTSLTVETGTYQVFVLYS